MNKLAFTFLSCSLLNCAFALDVTKAKNSFTWHNHAITQKISCIEKSELKTKFNSDKNSKHIARLIALARLGIKPNTTLQLLDISGLNDKYIKLMTANNIGELANIIEKDKIQSLNINNENDAKKLNTFFGFACAINARTQNKTFSRTDIDATVDQTISDIQLSRLNSYKSTIKSNLWNAFNSWEIHALDHVLREEKNGVQNSRALENKGQNLCFFNASMQAVYACKPLREFIINDLKDNKDYFVIALRSFLNAMSTGTGAVDTGRRCSNGNGLAYNVLKHITGLTKEGSSYKWSDRITQEDSSEFLRKMIDKIHDALKEDEDLQKKFEDLIYSNYYYILTAGCKNRCKSTRSNEESIIEIEMEKGNSVQKLFTHKLKQEESVKCTCSQCDEMNVSIAKESIKKAYGLKDTELMHPNNPNWSQYSKEIEYAVEKYKKESTETTYLTNPSKILPISLKRFTHDSYGNKSKNTTPITPNQILHVYDYINRKSYKYILNSVSVHSGGLGGGHYYAYQRVGNNWWKKDDEKAPTTLGNEIPEDAENGYVFFYERLDEATSMNA